MKYMQRLWMLLLWIGVIIQPNYSQQPVSTHKKEISINELIERIEANTPYRIFSIFNESFMVSVDSGEEPSVEQLKKSLEGTGYHSAVYENWVFILKEEQLITTFSPSLVHKEQYAESQEGAGFLIRKPEKAISENKVYTIGNPHIENPTGKVTLSGQVTDFKTGEPLMGINLILAEPWIATTTNASGHYSITLPSGRTQLDISGLNIKKTRRQLMLHSDAVLDIELEEEEHILDEVTILSNRIQHVKNTQIGVERLQVSRLKNIPMALGEVDVLKAIQALPGVKTVGEASSGFNVRGGATDQNLILLNDGTIYNANHLFGFFTAFSSEMVKEADIYKSSIPVQYGGRISSVLDISVKEANKEKFTGSAGIGLVTSKLNLEMPLIKNRTSLMLTGRTTYSDWILKKLPEKSGYKEGAAGFYDMSALLSHKHNDANLLTVFGYYSHDRFSFSEHERYGYTNLNASAKWRTVFNENLMAYFTAGYDHYDYQNTESKNQTDAFKLSFNINQLFAKADFNYNLNPAHKLDFGWKSMLYDINPGKYEPANAASLVKKDELQKDKALETAFFIGDEWTITPKFSVNAGIRYSLFNALGPRRYNVYAPGDLPSEYNILETVEAGSKVLKTYHGPEFRLSTRYAFTDNLSVKAGFNSMRQYIHKLSNTVIMSPTDTWKLSDANVRPQRGWQAATGLYLTTPDNLWEFSVEGYYKQMDDYLDYRSGARILMNHHIETDVISTEGHAYGVELSVRKIAGKFNGWMNYTYARTFLRQNNELIKNPVNNGDWYPTEYDKPHEFKFVGNYKITHRYSFSINVDYSTGRPTTIPAGQYYDREADAVRIYYTDRNSYRIPDYFRTDISFNIEPSHKLTLLTHSSISIGVYNVTGRKNVYSIYYVSEGDKIKGYQMSIFGVPIPFITYNIKF